jgi:hypothetical protein
MYCNVCLASLMIILYSLRSTERLTGEHIIWGAQRGCISISSVRSCSFFGHPDRAQRPRHGGDTNHTPGNAVSHISH